MLGRAYARKVAERFAEQLRDERAVDPERGRFARASGDTTHLSVMDRDGNVVGLTQSIESIFGSCEASEELGFLYNNYLSTFEYVDISHPHYLRPGASPWASVAPSIIYDENGPQMVIGSPGSERIVSAISQVLLRMEHQEPLHAVAAPRLHGALDGSVSVERERMRLEVLDHLEALELELVDRGNWSFFMGSVQLVLLDGDGFIGVADPRRDGAAEGPTS
jgi:gamma-glutamyltranspeptidase/glutathione hydrolase